MTCTVCVSGTTVESVIPDCPAPSAASAGRQQPQANSRQSRSASAFFTTNHLSKRLGSEKNCPVIPCPGTVYPGRLTDCQKSGSVIRNGKSNGILILINCIASKVINLSCNRLRQICFHSASCNIDVAGKGIRNCVAQFATACRRNGKASACFELRINSCLLYTSDAADE